MWFIPELPAIPGYEICPPEKALALLRKAAALGYDISPDGYFIKLSIPQIEALLEGRTDA